MVLSSDSCHAVHPEQEAVVLAGFACEEDTRCWRQRQEGQWPQQPGLSYSRGTMGSTVQYRLLPAGPRAALQP